MDKNKSYRDYQRRVLQKAGWEAGNGLKKNGSFKWIWIFPGRKKAYSREEAFKIAQKQLARQK
jgi:hypothetical protein